MLNTRRCVSLKDCLCRNRKLSSFIFFFKQKTAYEVLRSLVGSEMCIRDRCNPALIPAFGAQTAKQAGYPDFTVPWELGGIINCLLYTSDAADE